MARKALAFRHVPFEHLGLIADALVSRHISYEYVDLPEGGPCPSLDGVDALIFMGGPMSANDDLGFIRREIELISEAVALGMPILGVCLGAQLIAKALGSGVYPSPVKEIGWYPVSWTAAATRDRLHQGISEPETVFQWHGETFDLPSGAELLAYSEGCRNQAFRLGEKIYGFQYHLEVTPEMIAGWLAEDARCGDAAEVNHSIDPHAHAARLKELAARIFGRWCNLILG